MAQKFLLKLRLTKQGVVKGSSGKREGDLDFSSGLECHGFQYGVTAPYDAGSGLPTGKRQHKPITIIREVDSASPLLWQALCTNEGFQTATLKFNRPDSSGKESLYSTIELTNGVIVNIKRYTESTGRKCEELTLSYHSVTVNGIANGVIHPT
jgi:type VI secretion system secreted protein Hcp